MSLIGRCCHCQQEPLKVGVIGRDVNITGRAFMQGQQTRTVDLPAMSVQKRVKSEQEELDGLFGVDEIDPNEIGLLCLIRPEGWPINTPSAAKSIALLEAGRTIFVVGNYYNAGTAAVINTWLEAIGSTMRKGPGEYWNPPREDTIAVSGTLCDNVNTWYYAEAGITSPGDAEVLAQTASGDPVLLLENLHNGRLIWVQDNDAMSLCKNEQCDSEQFLSNMYWDVFDGQATRCDRIGLWQGFDPSGWQITFPKPYEQVVISGAADLTQARLGSVFLGHSFGGSGFAMPTKTEDLDAVKDFVQAGGSLFVQSGGIHATYGLSSDQIVACNTLLAHIGSSIQVVNTAAYTGLTRFATRPMIRHEVLPETVNCREGNLLNINYRGRLTGGEPIWQSNGLSDSEHWRCGAAQNVSAGRVVVLAVPYYFYSPEERTPAAWQRDAHRILRNFVVNARCSS